MFCSTKKIAKVIVKELFDLYEPGNQQKSIRNIWRLYIRPKYGISYRTLLQYKKIAKR